MAGPKMATGAKDNSATKISDTPRVREWAGVWEADEPEVFMDVSIRELKVETGAPRYECERAVTMDAGKATPSATSESRNAVSTEVEGSTPTQSFKALPLSACGTVQR